VRLLEYFLVNAKYDLLANVCKEGVCTPLNWVGVAIGGSRHLTVEVTMDLCWKIETIAAPRGDLRPAEETEQKEGPHAPDVDRCGMPDGRHASRLDRR